MRKVLIISYSFPPRAGAGGNRIAGLVQYLPEFGWDPIVLTATLPQKPNSNRLVIETEYSDKLNKIKMLLGIKPEESSYENSFILKGINSGKSVFLHRTINLFSWIFFFPDRYSSWYKNSIKELDILLRDNQIHGIISSHSPIVSHMIAKYIKRKKNGIKWIADYRDLWSNSPYLNAFKIQRKLMFLYESSIIKRADYITTVSDPLARDLSGLHHKSVNVIMNGFDPQEIYSTKLSCKFEIIYTGQLYYGRRDPTILFKALNEAINEGSILKSDLSILFYGRTSVWLDGLIEQYGLDDCAFQMGNIDKEIAKLKQHEAQLLMLLNWDSESDVGNITGKIFEYIAAQRPIISIGREDSVVSKLIASSKIGIASNNYLSIKEYLLSAYQEYKTYGHVHYTGDASVLEGYTQVNMAKRFADLLSI